MSDESPPRIGIVTGERAPDLSEDGKKVASALSERGFDVEAVLWTDESVDWTAYDAAIVRSCWDYPTDLGLFRDLLSSLELAGIPVCNPLGVIRWNLHKSYLKELEDKGVRIPPMTVVEKGEDASLGDILEGYGWKEAVVKPGIGTSSRDVWRASVENTHDIEGRFESLLSEIDVVVQAFVPEISEGERSIVFFGGEYSHAWNSLTAEDDFSGFVGHDIDYEPTPRIVNQAANTLRTACDILGVNPDLLPYGRVDYVHRDTDILLMELELIEPYLGLERGENAVERFCEAIITYFQSRQPNIFSL